MGTITERVRKDNKSTFTAQIRLKRGGKVYHSEAQTFDRRPAAVAWLKKREAEISLAGDPKANRGKSKTLSDAIDKYTEDSAKAIGRTKTQVLRSIKDYDIASQQCDDITSADLIEFAKELGKQRKPQTVANYLSHLAAIFAIAKPAWGYALDQQAMKDATAVARKLGLTGKGYKRERRPTLAELDTLLTAFQRARVARPASNPMVHIIAFGIFSTRRQEEITRIQWDDFEPDNKRVLVRDMKNPGDKVGNHVWCDLPDPALKIIEAMPRTAKEIFPYSTDAISAAFTRKCASVGIEDLHFHDLRHDGVSRLFEMGLNIPHVAAVSGHRSWQSLQRYTHVRQAGDKYENWPWFDAVFKAP